MRLFPCFMRDGRLAWGCIPCVVQPAMPFGINAACLNLAVEDHPALFVVLGAIENIALRIAADFFAVAGGKDLGADGLAVPPCDEALEKGDHGLPFRGCRSDSRGFAPTGAARPVPCGRAF